LRSRRQSLFVLQSKVVCKNSDSLFLWAPALGGAAIRRGALPLSPIALPAELSKSPIFVAEADLTVPGACDMFG
jgi:hypothetical protein